MLRAIVTVDDVRTADVVCMLGRVKKDFFGEKYRFLPFKETRAFGGYYFELKPKDHKYTNRNLFLEHNSYEDLLAFYDDLMKDKDKLKNVCGIDIAVQMRSNNKHGYRLNIYWK